MAIVHRRGCALQTRCAAPGCFARERAQAGPPLAFRRSGYGRILGESSDYLFWRGLSFGNESGPSEQSEIFAVRGCGSVPTGAAVCLRSERNARAAGRGGGRGHESWENRETSGVSLRLRRRPDRKSVV